MFFTGMIFSVLLPDHQWLDSDQQYNFVLVHTPTWRQGTKVKVKHMHYVIITKLFLSIYEFSANLLDSLECKTL